MKRYRVLRFDLDTRAHVLGLEIQDHWTAEVKESWRESKQKLKEGIAEQYGPWAIDDKIRNLIDIGSKPFSVIAFHNTFLSDCRDAFVIGAYYPALVGVCALGERVLNHLLLNLREHYRATPEYKRVYRKNSFDNWDLAISTLQTWGVLTDQASQAFTELAEMRNRAIHFDPVTDHNDRELAQSAIRQFQSAILAQFSGIGQQPWFIPDTPGEAYIRREWEDNPFVKEVYLPNCVLVGPRHALEMRDLQFVVSDSEDYPDEAVSDEEFVELRKAGRHRPAS